MEWLKYAVSLSQASLYLVLGFQFYYAYVYIHTSYSFSPIEEHLPIFIWSHSSVRRHFVNLWPFHPAYIYTETTSYSPGALAALYTDSCGID